jgi:hypothetical protein
MKRLLVLLMALALTACDYTEVKREIGYKGKARINPWLAAERFCERFEGKVRSLAAWSPPQDEDAVWFAPASILSNESFTHQVETWVHDGGHLVLLVEHADSETNDWARHPPEPPPEAALVNLLERSGITLEQEEGRPESSVATGIEFNNETFEVDAESKGKVTANGAKSGVFASVASGDGRMTVLTDGRLFRNRWIGDKDHAALLDALIRGTEYEGNICFLRGSGMSLWGLLGTHLWPVLVGLGALTLLWLWKNFTRFGPVEAVGGAATLRGYDHHLEALGNFQWRLDRGVTLLAPLRTRIIERGQHLAAMRGRKGEDFHQFLAECSGLPTERIARALAETSVPDSATLTRTTADLQLLLQLLN